MTRIASLGMYDHPGQRAANDRLWAGIAERLIARGVHGVPRRLHRDTSVDRLWHDPGLLFGQACGYPLVTHPLPLRVLALPVYAAPGSGAGRHRSLIVARAGDPTPSLAGFRGRRAAINDIVSNTGMNLFRAAIAPLAGRELFFAGVTITGAHRDSIRAVVDGTADLAAIDAVTYDGLIRFEPTLVAGVRIVAETPSSPTLPFVTARDTPLDIVAALRLALEDAIADPALADVRAALALIGIVPTQAESFAELRIIARRAAEIGYPELR
jgi:ABC-type phosphate/phosphonate transport system substrate-binding protein